jgi:hypothetical protein
MSKGIFVQVLHREYFSTKSYNYNNLGQLIMGIARVIFACCAAAISLSAASANENITYSYDSEGRLVTTSRSGTVNNGVSAQQSYDRADNRTNLTVSGSANGSPGGGNNPPVAVNDAASLACNGGGQRSRWPPPHCHRCVSGKRGGNDWHRGTRACQHQHE